MMKIKAVTFFKKWNGGIFAPLFLGVFFFTNHIMNGATGDEYSMLSLVGIINGLCKVFMAEFIASVMLRVMQPDYFYVIHDDENLTIDKKTPSWRDSAYKFYALYFLVAGLILAFA